MSSRYHSHLWVILEMKEPTSTLDVIYPKQFKQRSYRVALSQALNLTSPEHLMVLSNEREIEEVEGCLDLVPADNILIQPSSWGNGAAFLLLVLEIQKRDPNGLVLFLPTKASTQCPISLEWMDARQKLLREHNKVYFLQKLFNPAMLCDSAVVATVSTLLRLYAHSAPELLQPFLGMNQDERVAGSSEHHRLASLDLFRNVLMPQQRSLQVTSFLPTFAGVQMTPHEMLH